MIALCTNDYERKHLVPPRGRRRWRFEIHGKVYPFTGLYSDAKRRAIKKARELDAATMGLLP